MSVCVTCRSRRVSVTRSEDDVRAIASRLARARDEKRAHLMDLLSTAKAVRESQRYELERHLAHCEQVLTP